jgi:hypothetical protein
MVRNACKRWAGLMITWFLWCGLIGNFHILFLAEGRLNMKPKSILNVSKPFGTAQMAAALTSAPDMPVPDNDAPTTTAATWHDAFVSHSYAELKENLAKNAWAGRYPITPKCRWRFALTRTFSPLLKPQGVVGKLVLTFCCVSIWMKCIIKAK